MRCNLVNHYILVYFFDTLKNPAANRAAGFSRKGLERREVEKRIYESERHRLTASVAFHVYRIPEDHVRSVAKIRRFFHEIVNFLRCAPGRQKNLFIVLPKRKLIYFNQQA